MPKPRNHPRSREFAVQHEDSSVSDAGMHADLLDNDEADLSTRRRTARRLLAEGHDRAALARAYDLPPDFDRERPGEA